MRSILGLLLLLFVGTSVAHADVGMVRMNRENQVQRSGDRFRVGVSEDDQRLRTFSMYIKKRKGERPLRADLSVGDVRQADAVIPVKMTAAKNNLGYYVSFEMTNAAAEKSELAILVDFTGEDGIQVGTSYQFDLGSYFEDP